MNVQASNQLASCEGARIVILCDINDDDDNKEQIKGKDAISSSENSKYLSKFQTISRAISLYGMYCKEMLQGYFLLEILLIKIRFFLSRNLTQLHCSELTSFQGHFSQKNMCRLSRLINWD